MSEVFMIWCSIAGQVVLNTSKDNGAFIFTVQQLLLDYVTLKMKAL
jgi:hypothetical protein